ncbi:hypothetical protein F2Q68_00016277 [Brassica cretica]|uniref:Uncharacterized protein n=1 Tax=Brassica cretica TaxID=69181 RepID=A0A8S9HIJ5_BRACR|nr:hypothetical protein F2Q68_00016277 [Brassica cretica]
MPPVKDLIFKDAYVDAARTKVLSDGSMNYVVELYDTALKETISKAESITRREEGPEGEVHGEVWRAEGQIQDCWREDQIPPVLPSSDPGSAPLGASSIVDEEAPAREVGPGDADPVLPAEGRETRPGLDDLVELSDSSIERSGQNESSDGAPPGVGEDLNASSVERGERGSEDAIAQVPEEPESRNFPNEVCLSRETRLLGLGTAKAQGWLHGLLISFCFFLSLCSIILLHLSPLRTSPVALPFAIFATPGCLSSSHASLGVGVRS